MHFTEYHTRLAAYAVLVNEADEILLTWFNGGPHGTEPAWSLPGGGVEFDERITDGLVREVLEETGYDVRVGELLAEHHFTGMSSHRADLPFRSQRFLYAAEIVGGRWSSWQIITLYVVGAVFLAAFIAVELRASEPLLPLRLFRSSVFTWANVAALGVAMVMFGSIIYIPVFAQGVMGVNATQSGLILMPMMLGMIVMGIVTGLLITRTGRYKLFMVIGVVLMAVGVWLLTRLTVDDSPWELFTAMTVLGVGLGMAMQQYTLVVQNVVDQRDMGVATATTQFSRNIGSTVGIAVYGSIMTGGLVQAIGSHLPPAMREQMAARAGDLDVGAVLDPSAAGSMPPVIADAVRAGLADQLHDAFLIGLPLLAVVLVATLLIRHVPLRETVHTNEDAQA